MMILINETTTGKDIYDEVLMKSKYMFNMT